MPWQDVRLFYNLKHLVLCQRHNFTLVSTQNIASEFFNKFVSSVNMGAFGHNNHIFFVFVT